ncbi:MAG: PEP-CTERM sorting domain-containing protein [Gammaproteobacteria bacterium]|nr:PEP-CTERM sorting domain-containing protein [Gammaproteobacteria bacterium]
MPCLHRRARFLVAAALTAGLAGSASATVVETILRGSDAIWLAGRTDLVIPPAGVAWPGGLARHPITPEMIQETLPPGYSVNGGDVIRVLDPADGGISFFNGFGGIVYGPDGNGVPGSSIISSFGGISGYIGTQGALVGVFLDGAIPLAGAPATLDFSNGGLGTEFLSLTPGLGQVFYIGNGVTSGNVFQDFIAPAGATRLFLGITDGFGFNGPPGAFDDNDGSYRIRIGINEDPRNPLTPMPEPAPMLLLGIGLLVFAATRLRRRPPVPLPVQRH